MKAKAKKIALAHIVEMMNDGFKRMDAKMDAGFKQVNARMDKLETRIDRIDQRLDYNGLKKLPN